MTLQQEFSSTALAHPVTSVHGAKLRLQFDDVKISCSARFTWNHGWGSSKNWAGTGYGEGWCQVNENWLKPRLWRKGLNVLGRILNLQVVFSTNQLNPEPNNPGHHFPPIYHSPSSLLASFNLLLPPTIPFCWCDQLTWHITTTSSISIPPSPNVKSITDLLLLHVPPSSHPSANIQ